ncbi:MAG: outer membrane beta-barrel protein [bacterium]|nr:outer membrane beta-barrel protein [bacterium]
MKNKVILACAVAICAMAIPVSAGPLADATSDMLWGIEIGGYIDLGFNYNLSDPSTDMNSYRYFDNDEGDFVDFHALQFSFDKLPEDVDEVGFRVDMMYGEDAPILGGGDGVLDDGNLNIYQAYLSYIAPVGNGLTIDVGRFKSFFGYEEIESGMNDQFSRSLLFGYAIPHTNTGARFTYTVNEMWEVSYALTQGWDTVEDTNDSLSHSVAIRAMPTEKIFIQNSFSYGPEMPGDNGSYTWLYDLVGTYQATDQLRLGANFDYGDSEDADLNGGDAQWWGVGGYARYDVNDKIYAALRGEWFEDNDNIRLFAPLAPNTNTNLWEITATLGYQVVDGLLTRVEYRHDDASEDIFVDDSGLDDAQDTVSLEVIYSF